MSRPLRSHAVRVCHVVFVAAAFVAVGGPILAQDTEAPPLSRITVQYGHAAAITDTAVGTSMGLIATASQDGAVRVWSPSDRVYVGRVQVSSKPVERVAIHPIEDVVATVHRGATGEYLLSEWNFRTGDRISQTPLSSLPNDIFYSPLGSFVVHINQEWRGVTFRRAGSGRAYSYLEDGFGPVEFAVVSGREERVLTYQSSLGLLTYTNITTGEIALQVETVPRLRGMQLLTNDRYAAALGRNSLYVIDLLTGDIRAEIVRRDAQMLAVRPSDGEIGVVTNDGEGGTRYAAYRFDGERLIPRFRTLAGFPANATAISFVGDQALVGDGDGTVYSYDRYGRGGEIVARRLLPVESLAVSGDRLTLAAGEQLVTLRSDLFTNVARVTGRVRYAGTFIHPNPLAGGAFGVTPITGGSIALYDLSGDEGRLHLFNPIYGAEDSTPVRLEAPIVSVRSSGAEVAVVDREGTVSVLAGSPLAPTFTYAATSAQVALKTPAGLFIGKPRLGRNDGSLIQVRAETGETALVPHPASLVIDLAYDAVHETLYSLGIETVAEGDRLTISEHPGPSYATSEVLYEVTVRGAAPDSASLAVDPEIGEVFVAAGDRSVYRLRSTGTQGRTDSTSHVARRLYVAAGLLYGANTDGSVSVWMSDTGRHLFDIYLFDDGAWMLVTPQQFYYLPDGYDPTVYCTFTPDPRSAAATIYDLRLHVPATIEMRPPPQPTAPEPPAAEPVTPFPGMQWPWQTPGATQF